MNRSMLYPLLCIALTGCASDLPRNMPLVFGEAITVGIGIGASTADQGGDFTLGFKSKDVAIIPVVAYDNDGSPVQIQADISDTTSGDESTETTADSKIVTRKPVTKTINKDSYSVLGQFGSVTDGAGKRVGLGKFFATGAAALQLSEGFAACLKKDNCGSSQAATGK